MTSVIQQYPTVSSFLAKLFKWGRGGSWGAWLSHDCLFLTFSNRFSAAFDLFWKLTIQTSQGFVELFFTVVYQELITSHHEQRHLQSLLFLDLADHAGLHRVACLFLLCWYLDHSPASRSLLRMLRGLFQLLRRFCHLATKVRPCHLQWRHFLPQPLLSCCVFYELLEVPRTVTYCTRPWRRFQWNWRTRTEGRNDPPWNVCEDMRENENTVSPYFQM